MKVGECWRTKKHVSTEVADRVSKIDTDEMQFDKEFVKDEINQQLRVVIEYLEGDTVGYSILYFRLKNGGPKTVHYVHREAFLVMFEKDDELSGPSEDA